MNKLSEYTMKRSAFCLLLSAFCFLISACSEFFERSVEDRKVILLAPGDSTEGNIYNQNFWWERVEDATAYRLQIVTPSFDSVSYLVVDTLVNDSKFTYTLDPGKYQWRVRAENGSTQSLYTTASFIIHESSIGNQQVRLKSPGINLVTNEKEIQYQWERIFGAGVYRLQVDTNNFQDETALVYNNTTSNLQLTVPLGKEKTFQWRVRAENEEEQSKWSAVHRVTYDITNPVQVQISSPATNTTVSKPVNLQWIAIEDAKSYELRVLKSDSTTAYTGYPVTVGTSSYSFNSGNFNERVYWQVRAIDEAGNKGEYSALRNFVIR